MSLSDQTTSALLDQLSAACAAGHFGQAMAAADELCRPERVGSCADLAAKAASWPAMQAYTPEQLQGLEDRIEQYNAYAKTRPIATRLKEAETALIEAAHDLFDENSEPMALFEAGDLITAVLEHAKKGGPPVECKLSAALNAYLAVARLYNTQAVRSAFLNLTLLSEFLTLRGKAARARLAGLMLNAERHEASAERRYNALSQDWKW
jgi:hypothetical protein